MPRFWWTAAGFVTGAAVALGAAYALSEAVDPVYPGMKARVDLFHARAPALQSVSVGNSHTRALDFAALNMRGVHFWEGGQDVFESAYLARYAAERAPRLRYVLFTASYGMERLDHAGISSRDVTRLRREIYARTSPLRFIPGDAGLWVGARFAPIARPDHWHGVVTRLHRPRRTIRTGDDGSLYQPPRPPLSRDSLVAHATRRAAHQARMAAESVESDPTTPTRAIRELESLARHLHARGVHLVLYTPPYHAAYLQRLEANAAAETRRALAPLLRHANVVWMDFGMHPGFAARDDLFYDSDHMNADGARSFSALLRDCVAALSTAAGPGLDCRTGAHTADRP